ncbi:MAG: hypothetical protein CEE40_00780 [Chloroflexi bacterium B3_Chlor]|nr:MAG: hypothetical protein CEE40_00780 [Chloroflexi bacterium B3_Chlor]
MTRRIALLWVSGVCIVAMLAIGGCTREKPMATPTATAQGEIELVSPSPTPLPVSTPSLPEPIHYTVQAGDTVWAIADRFGVTPDALVEANALLEPDRLQPGQELLIPTGDETASDEPAPTESPSADTGTTEGGRIHTVRGGDTLWSIAIRYDTTVDEIATLNELDPEGILALGQQLLIP